MKKIKVYFENSLEFQTYLIDKLSDKYIIEISDNPDFVFFDSANAYKCFQYDCVRILMIGENLRPDFNLFDYACGFDYMEFGDRYLHYPNYCNIHYREEMKLALERHLFSDEYYLSKKKFCNMVVSNGKNTNPIREFFFGKLNEYKRIDSAGRYLNNMENGWTVPGGGIPKFRQKYRFSFAFENSAHKGYTTEKIVRAFAGATIPIYWGDPLVTEQFNPKSFINISGYEDIDGAIKQIKEIDNNPELFLKMVKEPILLPNSPILDMIEDKYLFDFISNIFDQEPDKAVRRTNRYDGWGYHYENKYKIQQEFMDNKFLMLLFRIIRKINRKH